jgi:hypothetical protein
VIFSERCRSGLVLNRWGFYEGRRKGDQIAWKAVKVNDKCLVGGNGIDHRN